MCYIALMAAAFLCELNQLVDFVKVFRFRTLGNEHKFKYTSVPAHCLYIDLATMTGHQICSLVLNTDAYATSHYSRLLPGLSECTKEVAGKSVPGQTKCSLQP